MKNFTHLNEPGFPYFTKIVTSKKDMVKKSPNLKKAKLLEISSLIEARYKHYSSCFSTDDLHKVSDSTFSGFDKECLLDAYVSSGSALDALKFEIKNLQASEWQNKCPYCGISPIDQTDHYLPKEDYSEYSVLSLNLVPSCGTCNRKKGEYWKVNGIRKIINFYLDSIPEQQFLFCDFSFDERSPKVNYRLSHSAGISESKFTLIFDHFERLGLLKRYKDHSNDVITSTIDSITSYCREMTENGVRTDMLAEHGKKVSRYGINHWVCVLLEAMANSADFTRYLVEIIKTERLETELGL